MNKLILILILSIHFSACKKVDLSSIKPNNNLFGQQCINDPKKNPVSSDSPYRNEVFKDTFDGGSGTCYTQKPKCAERLDYFSGGDCKFDANEAKYSGLKNLNKCVWKVWHGWNFWNSARQMTFNPEAIEVSGGTLKLKVLPNPYYNAKNGNCGDVNPAAGEWAGDRFNQNCKLITGAVDSKYVDHETKGRNARYGRIEIRARFKPTTPRSSYPALWMWPDKLGQGHPHNPTAANTIGGEPDPIGEIDILELNAADSRDYIFQSLHNWRFKLTNKSSYVSNSRAVNMADYHTYGVEWSEGKIKFIIDECYTTEIKNGDRNNRGAPANMSVPDTASFIMMWSGGGGSLIDDHNRDVFEIDEVRIYE
jgi:hypothetical protein